MCRRCARGTAPSPPCGTRSSPLTRTYCFTTWGPISPTSASASRSPPTSAPSRCSTCAMPSTFCTTAGRRRWSKPSRATAGRLPAHATGSRDCRPPTARHWWRFSSPCKKRRRGLEEPGGAWLPSPPAMSFLSLEGVSKRFDGVTAVDGVSFAIDPGEVVGFLGPNGAGKSTTMRLITQYYEPDTGEIKLDGVPLADAAREAKRRIGYLAENNPLYDDMLVADYLEFIADLRELAGPGRRQALDEAVTGTGVETVYYRPIGELSKGFRQRVGLAQAILHRPDLLILDEPTEGLDPNQRVEIRRLIGALGKDRTVILSTHLLP